jgi:dihydroorotate dehydrogenase
LDAEKVINVTPRYAKLQAELNGAAMGCIIGWQNIELISDRPLETMLNEFRQLKKEYPDRILIGSIMEEYNKAAWHELIERVEESGVVPFFVTCLFCCICILEHNGMQLMSIFVRMLLRLISRVHMACQREKWVLLWGKTVIC